jgi:uncharacterized damage-inducible protein DinB
MSNPEDSALRRQLIDLLNGGHAHATFDQAVRDFPADRAGIRPNGSPHSAWELLEHLRLAQEDILRFSQSADHVSPKWPEGYWPAQPAPADPKDWERSVRLFRDHLAEFESLLRDPKQELTRKFPWGDGQTLLREALLLADHNSYHIGQLVLVRRLLDAWSE